MQSKENFNFKNNNMEYDIFNEINDIEDEDMKCSICNYYFSRNLKPYSLKCNHNLCMKCIEGIVDKKMFNCPICRRCFNEEEKKNFKINENLLNLITKILDFKLIFCHKCRKIFSFTEHFDKCDQIYFKDSNEVLMELSILASDCLKVFKLNEKHLNILNYSKNSIYEEIYKIIKIININFYEYFTNLIETFFEGIPKLNHEEALSEVFDYLKNFEIYIKMQNFENPPKDQVMIAIEKFNQNKINELNFIQGYHNININKIPQKFDINFLKGNKEKDTLNNNQELNRRVLDDIIPISNNVHNSDMDINQCIQEILRFNFSNFDNFREIKKYLNKNFKKTERSISNDIIREMNREHNDSDKRTQTNQNQNAFTYKYKQFKNAHQISCNKDFQNNNLREFSTPNKFQNLNLADISRLYLKENDFKNGYLKTNKSLKTDNNVVNNKEITNNILDKETFNNENDRISHLDKAFNQDRSHSDNKIIKKHKISLSDIDENFMARKFDFKHLKNIMQDNSQISNNIFDDGIKSPYHNEIKIKFENNQNNISVISKSNIKHSESTDECNVDNPNTKYTDNNMLQYQNSRDSSKSSATSHNNMIYSYLYQKNCLKSSTTNNFKIKKLKNHSKLSSRYFINEHLNNITKNNDESINQNILSTSIDNLLLKKFNFNQKIFMDLHHRKYYNLSNLKLDEKKNNFLTKRTPKLNRNKNSGNLINNFNGYNGQNREKNLTGGLGNLQSNTNSKSNINVANSGNKNIKSKGSQKSKWKFVNLSFNDEKAEQIFGNFYNDKFINDTLESISNENQETISKKNMDDIDYSSIIYNNLQQTNCNTINEHRNLTNNIHINDIKRLYQSNENNSIVPKIKEKVEDKKNFFFKNSQKIKEKSDNFLIKQIKLNASGYTDLSLDKIKNNLYLLDNNENMDNINNNINENNYKSQRKGNIESSNIFQYLDKQKNDNNITLLKKFDNFIDNKNNKIEKLISNIRLDPKVESNLQKINNQDISKMCEFTFDKNKINESNPNMINHQKYLKKTIKLLEENNNNLISKKKKEEKWNLKSVDKHKTNKLDQTPETYKRQKIIVKNNHVEIIHSETVESKDGENNSSKFSNTHLNLNNETKSSGSNYNNFTPEKAFLQKSFKKDTNCNNNFASENFRIIDLNKINSLDENNCDFNSDESFDVLNNISEGSKTFHGPQTDKYQFSKGKIKGGDCTKCTLQKDINDRITIFQVNENEKDVDKKINIILKPNKAIKKQINISDSNIKINQIQKLKSNDFNNNTSINNNNLNSLKLQNRENITKKLNYYKFSESENGNRFKSSTSKLDKNSNYFENLNSNKAYNSYQTAIPKAKFSSSNKMIDNKIGICPKKQKNKLIINKPCLMSQNHSQDNILEKLNVKKTHNRNPDKKSRNKQKEIHHHNLSLSLINDDSEFFNESNAYANFNEGSIKHHIPKTIENTIIDNKNTKMTTNINRESQAKFPSNFKISNCLQNNKNHFESFRDLELPYNINTLISSININKIDNENKHYQFTNDDNIKNITSKEKDESNFIKKFTSFLFLLKKYNLTKEHITRINNFSQQVELTCETLSDQISKNYSHLGEKISQNLKGICDNIIGVGHRSNFSKRIIPNIIENSRRICLFDIKKETFEVKEFDYLTIKLNLSVSIEHDGSDFLFLTGGRFNSASTITFFSNRKSNESFGDLSGNFTDLFLILRWSSKKIEVNSQMPRKRAWHSSLYYNSKLYIIGGAAAENQKLRECECYNMSSKQWEFMPNLTYSRCNPGLCIYNQEFLYVFNGWLTKNNFLDTIEFINIKDFALSVWKAFRPEDPGLSWKGFSNCACAVLGENKILIFGGYGKESEPYGGFNYFEPENKIKGVNSDVKDELLTNTENSVNNYYNSTNIIVENKTYIFDPLKKIVFRGKDLIKESPFFSNALYMENKIYSVDNKNNENKRFFGAHVYNIYYNQWKFQSVQSKI